MLFKLFSTVVLTVLIVSLQTQGQVCVSESSLIEQFNNVSKTRKLYTEDGVACHIEGHHDDDDHHDDDHHDDEEDHHDEDEHDEDEHEHDEDEHDDEHLNSTCQTAYDVCRTVILNLGLTTADCLEEHDHENETTSSSVSSAQAYGYGFLMVMFVSFCSLGGILLVPLIINGSETGKRIYAHVYSFMIALAISTLVTDAILHLIPHAFGLHEHEDEAGDGHDHESTEDSHGHLDFVWKGCLILCGIYGFYLLEFILHTLGHNHNENSSHAHSSAEETHFTSDLNEKTPYSEIKSPSKADLMPSKPSVDDDDHPSKNKLCVHPKEIKNVAWLIIVGDAVHNIADGIALGAAISQSLSLGVSTMFAIVFHELPHEFGDYVILIKSGFHWSTALLINFLQSLGALLGFFIGVAISNHSDDASNWILAITAGLFLYIGLTDLLPELVHGGGHGLIKIPELSKGGFLDWTVRLILINCGFFVGFIILLILAIYEEDLNELI